MSALASPTNSIPRTQVPIGELLILREEYLRVAFDEDAPCASAGRAQRLLKVIDELITFREKEGSNAGSEQAL